MSLALPSALVASLPVRLGRYDAMALPASAFRPDQVLFGADAQAAVFLRVLEASQVPAVFVPSPEMFHDAMTFAAIERLLPESWREGDAPLRHLRFGPLKDSRLLKFAENAHFLAEAATRAEVRITGNPFSAREAVPAALRRVLRFGTQDALVCIDGQSPEHVDLPERLASADLTDWSAPAPADPARAAAEEIGRGALHCLSFAEWRRERAAAPEADILTRSRPHMRPSLALPFNLADPGSIVPEIVFNFARFPGPAESGIALTLLPYNGNDVEPRLERLINRTAMMLERREGDLAQEHLFVAHVRQPIPMGLLRWLFPCAVLDGGDPERAWVAARLAVLGLASVAHAPSAAEAASPVVPGRRYQRFDDVQSPRLIETEPPSRTRCMELLAEAHAKSAPGGGVALDRSLIDLGLLLGSGR